MYVCVFCPWNVVECRPFLSPVLFPRAATETAQQLKKTAGVPFHAKGRGLVKKIDTTSESLRFISFDPRGSAP